MVNETFMRFFLLFIGSIIAILNHRNNGFLSFRDLIANIRGEIIALTLRLGSDISRVVISRQMRIDRS